MKLRKFIASILVMSQIFMMMPISTSMAADNKTVFAKLTTSAPVIDGELDDSIWSLDNSASIDLSGSSAHSTKFDVKWDSTNVYFAVQVTGDTQLIDGDAWIGGDIVSIMLDPTCHQDSPYVTGDWQIGIGYNSQDNQNPYILLGSAVKNDTVALLNDISAATIATDNGWNAEFSLSWASLGINPNTQTDIGFDLAVDNKLATHGANVCDTTVWCAENNATSFWNDTSGFGILHLSNEIVSAKNEKILDIDFSDGTAKDNSLAAHAAVTKGSPAITNSEDLGKYMVSFDGVDDAIAYNLTASDFAKIQNGFTMECMMKLDGSQGSPFMDFENGGLGFQLNSDGKTLEFVTSVTGSAILSSASGSAIITSYDLTNIKSEWIHAVATYDGTAVNLYINGERKDSKPASGTLMVPGDSAMWLMIGSDTSNSGTVENPIACNISAARLYSGSMDSSTIAKLYARANMARIVFGDNNELTGMVGENYTVPAAIARDANRTYDVTATVTDPNKNIVSVMDGTFTPVMAGVYTITYSAANKTAIRKVTISAQTDWKQLDRTGIKVRFAVGSDIHIGSNNAASTKLRNALKVFNTIDPSLDAIAFVGDITDSGLATQYDTLMSIGEESGLSSKIKYCMGNHEFYGWSNPNDAINEFETKTGSSPNQVVKIGGANGITLIKLGAIGDNADYSLQYDFLKNALEASVNENPTAPIFVLAHHGVPNTAYTTNEWYGIYGTDMLALMAQYPQIIHISGHSHATVDDPRSIDQSAGFTCIQDGTVGAYFENESGKINSEGSHSTYPEYSSEASQSLMIEVDDNNVVTIKRMDLTSGKYINADDPWVINIPDLITNKNFTYTANRAETSEAPVFADDSAVSVVKAAANSVSFSFSQASAADNLSSIVLGDSDSNMVTSYKMVITNIKTGEKVRDNVYNRDYYLRFSDYYRASQASSLLATVSGLTPETEYKIEVWALTPYSVESSNSISTTFTTAAAVNAAVKPILDVDFTDGTAKDNSAAAHTAVKLGSPVISNSEDLGKNMASFDGQEDAYAYNLTASDYDNFKDSFTMECMFKLNSYDNADLFMNCEGAGLGYELNGDGKTLEFWAHINGSYVVPSVDITDIKSEWIHAVTTYDGAEIKLYINGVLKDTKNVTGSVDIPSESARWLMIGSDTGSTGNVQLPANCDISNARLFSGALSNKEVAVLYAKDTPVKAILDVDYSDGTAKDNSTVAHTAVQLGSPVISNSEDLGKNMASFDGKADAYAYNLTLADYDKFKNNFTMETMFKFNDFDNGDIFMNCEGAGLGYELNGDGQTLEFWAHINGSYVVASSDISDIKTKWIHAVTTYNGAEMKLYINGVLKDTKEVNGTLDIPGDSAKWLMIGSDTGSTGNVQCPANCDVSNARLYSGLLGDKEVAALYMKDNPVKIMLEMEVKSTGTVGDTVVIPTATGSNASETYNVTIDVKDPNGTTVDVSSGKLVLTETGIYTITYTAGSSTKTQSITVSSSTVTPQPTVTPTPTQAVTPTPTQAVTPTPTQAVTPTPTQAVTPKPTVTPAPLVQTRETAVNTDNGDMQAVAVKATITRTTERNGSKKDSLQLDKDNTAEAAKNALEAKSNKVKITIPELDGNKADIIEVQLPKDSTTILAKSKIGISIETEKASLELPTKTVAGINSADVDITISYVKNAEQIEQSKEILSQMAMGAEMLSTPLNIDTNYAMKTLVTIPIRSTDLPTNKSELKKFVESLAVLVEHSDGENRLQKGIIKYDSANKPVGISIWVDKFSTFTLVDTADFNGVVKKISAKQMPDKQLIAKFDQKLDASTVTEDTVYVLDSKGNKVDVKYQCTAKEIKIIPVNYYSLGETYSLYITQNIHYTSGKAIKNSRKYVFTIGKISLSGTKIKTYTNIAANKVWSINLGKKIDADTFKNSYVTVIDQNCNKIDVKVSVKDNYINVKSNKPYIKGNTYYIIIKGVKYENGTTISKAKWIKFTVSK